MTDRGVAHLASLPKLRDLHLQGTRVTGTCLAKFGAKSALKRLSLGETRIGDAAMPDVARLRNLEALWLHGTKITETGVAQLVGLKRLKRLHLPKRLKRTIGDVTKRMSGTEIVFS